MFSLFEALNIVDSSIRNRSVRVGLYSGVAAFIQLFAYGLGFMQELLTYIRKR
jgi:hypothetical protein